VSTTPAGGAADRREPLPPASAARNQVARTRRGARAWVRLIVPFVPALIPAAILVAIAVTLISASGFHNFGWGFFLPPSASNPYGVLVEIVGSFLTAVPALFLSMILGLGIAIASVVYLPTFISRFLDPFVDLLAGIPSVVYGLWAFVVIAPIFGTIINPWAVAHLSFIPGFAPSTIPPSPTTAGTGLPLAIIVLTLMALPITTLLIRDALRSIPKDLWESGLALGATRWEVMRRVGLRTGSRGIVSAAFLGFGRAIGETVAVAMVIGVDARFPVNVYDVTSTMAAYMFGSLDSAETHPVLLQNLAELALVLLAITLVVNLVGRRLVSHIYAGEVAGI
jgi:phosphate transport system permease protein